MCAYEINNVEGNQVWGVDEGDPLNDDLLKRYKNANKSKTLWRRAIAMNSIIGPWVICSNLWFFV